MKISNLHPLLYYCGRKKNTYSKYAASQKQSVQTEMSKRKGLIVKPEKDKPRSFLCTYYVLLTTARAYHVIYVLIILQSVLVIFWMINASVS